MLTVACRRPAVARSDHVGRTRRTPTLNEGGIQIRRGPPVPPAIAPSGTLKDNLTRGAQRVTALKVGSLYGD